MLDAIKVDPEQKVWSWSEGCVKSKVDGDKLRISFENDSHHSERELGIFSPEIAGHKTLSREGVEWRKALKANNRVDCFDSTGTWYACTILGLKTREYQGATIDMVHIAFRVGHPEGDKADAEGHRFFGWDDKFDEWMPRSSARIQEYGSRSDETFQNQTAEAQNNNSTTRTSAADSVTDAEDCLDLLVNNF